MSPALIEKAQVFEKPQEEEAGAPKQEAPAQPVLRFVSKRTAEAADFAREVMAAAAAATGTDASSRAMMAAIASAPKRRSSRALLGHTRGGSASSVESFKSAYEDV